jgi:hypothetical protein
MSSPGRVAIVLSLVRVAGSTALIWALHGPWWFVSAWLMTSVRVRVGDRRRGGRVAERVLRRSSGDVRR